MMNCRHWCFNFFVYSYIFHCPIISLIVTLTAKKRAAIISWWNITSTVMQSLRKLVNKPRVDDWNPLAKFYYADEALNAVANELDSFDGRRDPERCSHPEVKDFSRNVFALVFITAEMIQQVFPRESDRACRDYRVKFPEEIMHDNLPGQLWFGAECLTAGSNIIDHEIESEAIRPMARALTKHLDTLRDLLKDQSLRDPTHYSDKVKRSLKHFDQLFAEFELKALRLSYLTQDQIDDCDPIVMIAIPRLAIVCGLLYFPEGALNVDANPETLSDMFRSFHSLLVKIRDLLRILNVHELHRVEKALCTGETQLKFDEGNVEEALTIANFHLKTTGKEEKILKTQKLQSNVSSGSNSSDDGDCDAPSASSAAHYANNFAHRMLSPVHFGDSNESSGIKSSPKLDLLIIIDLFNDSTNEILRSMTSPPDPHRLRARFRSSADLIHRLFVCICGVADQLQTNYPTDLRRVLKMILQPNDVVPIFEVFVGCQIVTVSSARPVAHNSHWFDAVIIAAIAEESFARVVLPTPYRFPNWVMTGNSFLCERLL
ncbi:hypothetical protein X798_00445 [Onchocerca flexuosa]|uniref:Uncharacterized protein n=1 Tax=Onchocerca flexuosa TaxID=387005 RepID=A0A238C5T3_9BILA|nr:hypothetical protein X798_00445 [Onchocerca flexuosa]